MDDGAYVTLDEYDLTSKVFYTYLTIAWLDPIFSKYAENWRRKKFCMCKQESLDSVSITFQQYAR